MKKYRLTSCMERDEIFFESNAISRMFKSCKFEIYTKNLNLLLRCIINSLKCHGTMTCSTIAIGLLTEIKHFLLHALKFASYRELSENIFDVLSFVNLLNTFFADLFGFQIAKKCNPRLFIQVDIIFCLFFPQGCSVEHDDR